MINKLKRDIASWSCSGHLSHSGMFDIERWCRRNNAAQYGCSLWYKAGTYGSAVWGASELAEEVRKENGGGRNVESQIFMGNRCDSSESKGLIEIFLERKLRSENFNKFRGNFTLNVNKKKEEIWLCLNSRDLVTQPLKFISLKKPCWHVWWWLHLKQASFQTCVLSVNPSVASEKSAWLSSSPNQSHSGALISKLYAASNPSICSCKMGWLRNAGV